MDNVVNLRMLSHPVNWGIVWIVLAVAGYGSLLAYHSLAPGGGGSVSTP